MVILKCRHNSICPISGDLDKIAYFDLGNMPIVNNLTDTFEDSLSVEKYPLSISLFKKSNLSMLDVIVDPDHIFNQYTFRSSTNRPYYDHCKKMYEYLFDFITLEKDDLCIDIGGNDGTLLLAFNEISKELNLPICKKINIDPAENVSLESMSRGINTIVEYFGRNTSISKKAKLIVSTNVFQHLRDIQGFVAGINNILLDNGVWCLEFPYWAINMETNQFDQVYHEHIYYYLVTPLNTLFGNNNLKIINISEHFIHGGSLRLIVTKKNSKRSADITINQYLEREKKFNVSYYKNWSNKVKNHLKKCKDVIESIKDKNIVGFGAAAKGCIFLNKLKIDYNTIPYVIDDTKSKQNKYIPGTGIKIVSRGIIKEQNVDYILILAHNFSDYIIKSLNDFGYTGKYVILLPKIRIL